MAFLGVYRAIYDYAPQSDEELEIKDGDLLFVLEKSTEDDWWRCKKKAVSDDDDEPEGLVPNNYVTEARPTHSARALYDYTRQTDEELSFQEGAMLQVFDDSDPDWTLAGFNGQFGFVPAIYIDTSAASDPAAPGIAAAEPAPPAMPARPVAADAPIPGEADYVPTGAPSDPAANNPAAALAGIIAQRTGGGGMSPDPTPAPAASTQRALASPPPPSRPQYTPEESEEEEAPPPPKPQRPQSQALPSPVPTQYASSSLQPAEPPGVLPSPPYNRAVSSTYEDEHSNTGRSQGGFRMYTIHEMVTHMGKNKKMPTTLGIDIAKGVITILPEKNRDAQEWTADKLSHYSIEGKHVFVDLVRPSKSVDFHAGSKDTAHEIVALLGEVAGAYRAGGLREVMAASAGTATSGQKLGKMLYEFVAQGDDEVTVDVGDEVVVTDDSKSEEWWMVRRLKNGREGVVPSSYVEVTGTVPRGSEPISGLSLARSTVEQNRLEEERLAREATKGDRQSDSVPARGSSLAGETSKSRSHRDANRSSSSSQPKSKPNPSRVRTWTDRSGTFKVDAEFIGLREGKIHLHKVNGVKIAVPVSKMAVEDLEYVERATGASLDEDKPLSDIKRRSTLRKKEDDKRRAANGAGATIERKPDYDWFDFFLQCGVNPQICERYAASFSKDQMGPEILPDVNEPLLRTLGLKEGDILRVIKFLDNKYDRKRGNDGQLIENGGGSLFSGEGGVLKNNTRKTRPAAPVLTNDVVSDDAFKQSSGTASPAERAPPADSRATPLTSAPPRNAKSGFDDDAWNVQPSRTQTPVEPPKPAEPPRPVEPPKPKVNDDIASLSISTPALQPTPAPATLPPAPAPAQVLQSTAAPAVQQSPSQPPGANQEIFDKIAALAPGRQRPQPPPQQQSNPALGLPPPPRPISAPGYQQQQQNSFGVAPLQQQLTGYQPQQQQQVQQQQHPPLPQQTSYQTGFQQAPNGFTQQPQQTGVQSMQQNYPALQPQPTGLAFQPQSQFGAQQAAQHYGAQPGFQQQPAMNGMQTGPSPFSDPPRQPFQATAPNSFLPQQTGYQAQQQPGFNLSQPTGAINGFQAPPPPPVPQLPPQQMGGVLGPSSPAPLVAQKTGPTPPVRFGVTGAGNKLVPQPTGRANLAKATPQNPFGF